MQIAFNSQYFVCIMYFTCKNYGTVSVFIMNVLIKNTWQIAEVGRLKPLEVELQKLEDLSESIVKDFAYMRQRESEMRDTNGNMSVLIF